MGTIRVFLEEIFNISKICLNNITCKGTTDIKDDPHKNQTRLLVVALEIPGRASSSILELTSGQEYLVHDSCYSKTEIAMDHMEWCFESAGITGIAVTMVVGLVKLAIEKRVLHVPSAYGW